MARDAESSRLVLAFELQRAEVPAPHAPKRSGSLGASAGSCDQDYGAFCPKVCLGTASFALLFKRGACCRDLSMCLREVKTMGRAGQRQQSS